MMLALGMFVFELRTLPYQSMQHSKDYRWVSNDRVGKPPAYQFLGEGGNLYTACWYAIPRYHWRLDLTKGCRGDGQ